MTNELEKQFFDTFGIECNISFHQQFNGAQIPRGLEFYKKREELAKTGIIKIWHKMLNPRPENYCVYWGEYHYPQITDRILLELICIDNQENLYKCRPLANSVEELKTYILEEFIRLYELGLFKREHQVRTLFEES